MDNKTKTDQREGHETNVPLYKLLDSPLVDVYVGPQQTKWPLPKALLTHHSSSLAEELLKEGSTSRDSEEQARSGTGKPKHTRQGNSQSYDLRDEENETFQLVVAYLYSHTLPPAASESSVGILLDLYLLAQRLGMGVLQSEIVNSVRSFYHSSSTYPGLRRVQYIYAHTESDNEMREMMISSVARQFATGESIAAHWADALKRNGQLAVDIIRAIQMWHIEEGSIPDVRSESDWRGRKVKGVLSAVEREGAGSMETLTDSATGFDSVVTGEEDEEEKAKGADQSSLQADNKSSVKVNTNRDQARMGHHGSASNIKDQDKKAMLEQLPTEMKNMGVEAFPDFFSSLFSSPLSSFGIAKSPPLVMSSHSSRYSERTWPVLALSPSSLAALIAHRRRSSESHRFGRSDEKHIPAEYRVVTTPQPLLQSPPQELRSLQQEERRWQARYRELVQERRSTQAQLEEAKLLKLPPGEMSDSQSGVSCGMDCTERRPLVSTASTELWQIWARPNVLCLALLWCAYAACLILLS